MSEPTDKELPEGVVMWPAVWPVVLVTPENKIFLRRFAGIIGVAGLFLLFWLIFGYGYEPTVFYSE